MDVLSTLRCHGFCHLLIEQVTDPVEQLIELVCSFSSPYVFDSPPSRRPTVVDIKPIQGQDPHSFQGAAKFDLHTDHCWIRRPPRFATLFCLEPESAGGGESLLVDGYSVLAKLGEAEVQELKDTQYSFATHRDARKRRLYRAPILSSESEPALRFREDLIEEPLTEIARKFVELARASIHRFQLQRGSVLIVDNYRMLHGREPLREGLHSNRHLLRMHSR